jgi:hypothetical protein
MKTACANGKHKYLLEVFLLNPLNCDDSEVVGFDSRDEAVDYLKTRSEDSDWAMLFYPDGKVEEFFNVAV